MSDARWKSRQEWHARLYKIRGMPGKNREVCTQFMPIQWQSLYNGKKEVAIRRKGNANGYTLYNIHCEAKRRVESKVSLVESGGSQAGLPAPRRGDNL